MLSYSSSGSLSSARRRLLELFLRLLFGRIEGLVIRNGEPVLEPLPRVVRVYKYLPGENGRRARRVDTIAHTDQVTALFRQFDQLGNGTLDILHVQNALPFFSEIVGLPG